MAICQGSIVCCCAACLRTMKPLPEETTAQVESCPGTASSSSVFSPDLIVGAVIPAAIDLLCLHESTRSICLVIAEARRRATLLRLCCADYEVALHRLETLKELLQEQQRHQRQRDEYLPTPAAKASFGSAEGSAAYPGTGKTSPPSPSFETRNVYDSPETYDHHPTPRLDLGGPHYVNSNFNGFMRKDEIRCGSEVAVPGSSDSISITESLRQILELARSIRTSEGPTSSPHGNVNTVATKPLGRETARTDDRGGGLLHAGRDRAHTTSGNKNKVLGAGDSRSDGRRGQSVTSTGSKSRGGVNRPTAATLARQSSKTPLKTPAALRYTNTTARPASAAAAQQAKHTANAGRPASSTATDRRSSTPELNSMSVTRATERRPMSQAAHVDVLATGGRAVVGRRGSTGCTTRPALPRVLTRGYQSDSPDTIELADNTVQRNDESTMAMTMTGGEGKPEVRLVQTAVDLPAGMQEEMARYTAARSRLLRLGMGCRKRSDQSDATTVKAMGADDGESVLDEGGRDEEALLFAALDGSDEIDIQDPDRRQYKHQQRRYRPHHGEQRSHDHSRVGREGEGSVGIGIMNREGLGGAGSLPLGCSTPVPDPQFCAWEALLHERSCPKPERARRATGRRRAFNESDKHEVTFRNAAGISDCERNSNVHFRVEKGRVDWAEIERMQQSLIMLIDEVEGRRVLAAAKEEKQKSETAKSGGSGFWDRDIAEAGGEGWVGDGGAEGKRVERGCQYQEDRGNTKASLREFEDWYAWNKVAQMTQYLRQHIDARQEDEDIIYLSEEAAAIIKAPMRALGELADNPLRANNTLSRQAEPELEWRDAWKASAEAKGLGGTACFKFVAWLQADGAPPCVPGEGCWPDAVLRRPSTAPSSPAPGTNGGDGRMPGLSTKADNSIQIFRVSALLAAEQDVLRMLAVPLGRALSKASRRVSLSCPNPPNPKPDPIAKDGGWPTNEADHQNNGDAEEGNIVSQPALENLRERVPVVLRDMRNDGDGARPFDGHELAWAPTLAVYRAVDAVISRLGRPRVSFVRRSSDSPTFVVE